ncbi:MAG TPA: FKBP-type peptidyl-prolyl cis-trans isomerase [Candidatus Saccharimonadales bacterium]|nr:FKBP-type peptidyl-prolyl cis-trans isomerase [Candidatus Saccharimonadales bacterium]
MKTTIIAVIFSMTMVSPLLADDTNLLSDDKARVSYALGMIVGEGWKAHGATNLDFDIVIRGLKDAEAGGSTLMTTPEMRTTLMQFQQELAKQEEQRRQELGEKNAKTGASFLAKNKDKSGVVTLPDGLQYKVLAKGTGASPTANDTVTVSYTGTLLDGTTFDSSDKAQFRVGGVIPGWTEALTNMTVGAKWQLFIPSELAYGAYGRPPRIEPNSVLIFTVELLSIEHPQPITSDIIKVPSAEEIKNGAKVQIITPEELKKMQEQQQPSK